MFRRCLIAALFLLTPCLVGDARAQERVEVGTVDLTAALLNSSTIPAAQLASLDQFPMQVAPVNERRGSSSLLASLYATTAVMQALDVHSTLLAIKAGAVEGNPLMSGVVNNRGAFLATKAAVAASTILAARQIAKKSRIGAIVTMVAVNSAYAMIVRHNYSLAARRQ